MKIDNLLQKLTPQLKGKLDYSIGMIGAGEIACSAHLPAYQNAGFNVIAASDPSEEARNRARSEFGIAKTYESAEEMIANAKPDIIDIAVQWFQPDLKYQLAKLAAEAGCHILIQKPFAGTYEECVKIVECAEANNVKLAVNQQGRWGPAFHAAKQLAGILDVGTFQTVNFGIRCDHSLPYSVPDVTIHSSDLMRWWFNEEPESVFAATSDRDGNQHFVSAILKFSRNRIACIWDNFSFPTVVDWQFLIRGERGSVYGYDYYILGETRPWVEGWSESTGGSRVHVEPLEGNYIPLAFRFTMAELMNAIDEDREPLTSGRDNLNSISIVFALQKSIDSGQPVSPAEVRNP